jgi:hypothetical protein
MSGAFVLQSYGRLGVIRLAKDRRFIAGPHNNSLQRTGQKAPRRELGR